MAVDQKAVGEAIAYTFALSVACLQLIGTIDMHDPVFLAGKNEVHSTAHRAILEVHLETLEALALSLKKEIESVGSKIQTIEHDQKMMLWRYAELQDRILHHSATSLVSELSELKAEAQQLERSRLELIAVMTKSGRTLTKTKQDVLDYKYGFRSENSSHQSNNSKELHWIRRALYSVKKTKDILEEYSHGVVISGSTFGLYISALCGVVWIFCKNAVVLEHIYMIVWFLNISMIVSVAIRYTILYFTSGALAIAGGNFSL